MALRPEDEWPTKVDSTDSNYPAGKAQNITISGDGTGTPWIAGLINDIFGFQQRLLLLASITASGVNDHALESDYVNAMRKCAGYPGLISMVGFSSVPFGLRMVMLQGGTTSLLIKADLEAAVYVGDGNNATVHAAGGAFCKTSDSAGTTPSTSGNYLTLPDMRGRVPRGLDATGTVDPDGASRYLGDEQLHALQVHNHLIEDDTATNRFYRESNLVEISSGGGAAPVAALAPSLPELVASATHIGEDIASGYGVTGVGKVDDVETRAKNVALNFAMWW